MGWLTQNLILLLIIGLVMYRVHTLEKRMERIGKRAEGNMKRVEENMVNIVNRMAMAILRPTQIEVENIKADDVRGAEELVDHYVGYRLFSHTPALRRVLFVNIGVTFDFLREKGGIAADDLKGLEQQFNCTSPPSVFFPANGMVIEEWATHSVVTDFSGLRKVIYPDHRSLGKSWIDPVVIWSHSLPPTEADRSHLFDANMEVVLHEGFIKFWLRGGRFWQTHGSGEARSEYRLAEIPLQETNLQQYRVVHEPTGDPEIDIAHCAWIRQYQKDAPRLLETTELKNIWWQLTVNDIVSYVALR